MEGKGRLRDRWQRLTAWGRSVDMQDCFYVLLTLWAILPVVFAALRLLSPYLPWDIVGLTAVTPSTHLCTIYAKYFYILGGVTVCIAIVALAAVLPEPRDWKAASLQMPWHALLAFMLFWSLLSSLVSGNPVSCFWGLRYHNDGLSSYFIYGAIYICAYFLSRSDMRLKLLRAISLSGTFCSFHIFNQAITSLWGGVSPEWVFTRLNSVFLNINHCAYLLTVGILCAAGLWLYDSDQKRRPLHLLAYGIQVYALLMNDTLGCILAVLLSLPMICILYWQSGRKVSFSLFVPCILFIGMTLAQLTGILPGAPQATLLKDITQTYTDVTAVAEGSANALRGGSDRIGIWVGTLEHIAQRPIFGFGPDAAVQPWSGSGILRTHNEFLQHAMLLGIPAAVAYIAALLALLVYQWKRLREVEETVLIAAGALTGYLISSFFGITIFYTTPFLFFLLGMAAGQMKPASVSIPSETAGTSEEAETEKPDTPADTTDNRFHLIGTRKFLARSAIFSAAAVTAVLTILLYQEAGRERSDVSNMEISTSASETIEAAYNDGVDPSYEFWVDVEEETMNSTDAAPPAAYGRGTIIDGKLFSVSEASGRGYSAQTDYRGCVIRLRAEPDPENDGKYKVIKEWVIVEE